MRWFRDVECSALRTREVLFIDFTVVFYTLRRNSDRVRYLRHRRVYTTRPVGCYYAINVRGKGHRGGSALFTHTLVVSDGRGTGTMMTMVDVEHSNGELERLINDVDTTPQYICVCVSEWWQTHDETAPLSRGRKYDEDTWYLHEKINIIFKKKEKKWPPVYVCQLPRILLFAFELLIARVTQSHTFTIGTVLYTRLSVCILSIRTCISTHYEKKLTTVGCAVHSRNINLFVEIYTGSLQKAWPVSNSLSLSAMDAIISVF